MNDMTIRQRNLESSILFIQQQHAETLKSLHEEIAKLQKKSSDATYRLTLQIPEFNNAEVERIKKQYVDQLACVQKEHNHSLDTITKHEKNIKYLERLIKSQEKRYADELKQKQNYIDKLLSELKTKSNSIAQLVTELHKVKVQLRRRDSLGSASSITEEPFEPSPPISGAPKARAYRKLDTHDAHSRSLILRNGVHTFSEQSSVSSKIPDPSPFLRRQSTDSTSSLNLCLKSSHPLPPIVAQNITERKSLECDVVIPNPSCSPKPHHDLSVSGLPQNANLSFPYQSSAQHSPSFESH